MSITTHHGDCLAILPTLDAASVQTIVTSPPYWRMRQYTDDAREIGQEATPAAYVAALAAVFAECWRLWRRWLAAEDLRRGLPWPVNGARLWRLMRHIRAEHHEEIDHG